MAGKETVGFGSTEKRHGRNGQILVFVGSEGSGKSTQADFFAGAYHMPYVSASILIKDKAETDPTEIGEECRAVFREKRYMDPKILAVIYEERFKKPDTRNGFVLDGAMRTKGEIENFDRVLEKTNRKMPVIIVYLKVPGWLSAERLLRRKRADDTEEGILARLGHYYTQLSGKATIMKKKWTFLQVNAGWYNSPEDVSENIKTRLDALDKNKRA